MARYRGPRLKVIRRLGALLPGLMRTPADLRRPYPPGQHGPTKRGKLSDYALRLREKQKACFHYGVTEKQMRRYIGQAFRGKGNPGLLLLQALESRLDNVVFRAGFARTIRAARQIVRHGHIEVNGKSVDVPSLRLQPGDTLIPRAKSKLKEQMAAAWKDPTNVERPSYLACAEETTQAKVTGAPGRDDVPVRLQEQMIVEYYSGK